MKVAYIIQSFPALSETFIANELLAVRRAGMDLALFTFRNGQAAAIPGMDVVRLVSAPVPRLVRAHVYWLAKGPRRYLRVFFLAMRRKNGIGRLFFRKLHWVSAVADSGAEWVHAHFGWTASDLALLVHLMTGRRFTFTTHGSDIHINPPPNYRMKTALAHRHFTISNFNKQHLVTRFGLPAEQIRVAHCGIDFAELPPSQGPDGQNRIISVGRLVVEKGHDTLIRACATLAASGVDFHCDIIGEGPERSALESLIREVGAQNHVRLLGSRPHADVLRQLATATLAVLPSRSEGIPVFLMEAMAMRVAVIGPCITGVPELVDDGQSGFLLPPDNPTLLAEKMQMLLSDAALRTRFIEHAYAKVRAEFDCTRTVQPLLDIWNDHSPTNGAQCDCNANEKSRWCRRFIHPREGSGAGCRRAANDYPPPDRVAAR